MPTVDLRHRTDFEVEPPYRERIEWDGTSFPGLMRPGSVTFTTKQPHSPGRCVDVKLPGGVQCKGFVTRIENPISGLYQETIRFSGAPTFLGKALEEIKPALTKRVEREISKMLAHPNCRCVAPVKKERPVKIRNRFYVAADRVITPREQSEHSDWTKATLAKAIEHAEQILEDNPNKESVAIVQIVRVVRRKKAPVIVEVVK